MNSSHRSSATITMSLTLAEFCEASLCRHPLEGDPFLKVIGELPKPGCDIRLIPSIYWEKPDYWEIEVALFRSGNPSAKSNDAQDMRNGQQGTTQQGFERLMPLSGVMGHLGVIVIGANRRETIELSSRWK